MEIEEAIRIVDEWGEKHSRQVADFLGSGRFQVLKAMYDDWCNGLLSARAAEAHNMIVAGTSLSRIPIIDSRQALQTMLLRSGCNFTDLIQNESGADAVFTMVDEHGADRRFRIRIETWD